VAACQQFLDVEIPSARGVLQTTLLRQGLSIDLHYHGTPIATASRLMERKSFLSVWRVIAAIAPAVREIFAAFS
jgi:hypothetical protein